MEEIIEKYGEAIIAVGASVVILALAVALFLGLGAFSGLSVSIQDLLSGFFDRFF